MKYKNHKNKEVPLFLELIERIYYFGWNKTVAYYDINNVILRKWLLDYGMEKGTWREVKIKGRGIMWSIRAETNNA